VETLLKNNFFYILNQVKVFLNPNEMSFMFCDEEKNSDFSPESYLN